MNGPAGERDAQGLLLSHYRKPRRRGALPAATHHGRRVNPLCGDEVQMVLELRDGRVAQCRFDGVGCAIALGIADLLAAWCEGRTPQDIAGRLAAQGPVAGLLGRPLDVPPARRACADLAVGALRQALTDGRSTTPP